MSERKRDASRMIQTSVTLDQDTHDQLSAMSKWSRMSMSDVTAHALRCLFTMTSIVRSATMQTELAIVGPDTSKDVQKREMSKEEHIAIARKNKWVRTMCQRKCAEMRDKHCGGASSPSDIEFDLNRHVFHCAAYRDEWADDIKTLFVETGIECGLPRQRSERVVNKAVIDSASHPKKTPTIAPVVPVSKAECLRVASNDASDSAAGILSHLRGEGFQR